jgi:hypothetical protein
MSLFSHCVQGVYMMFFRVQISSQNFHLMHILNREVFQILWNEFVIDLQR